jgi:FHS family glucose/mannose:H+ symporter-like MFS transporter
MNRRLLFVAAYAGMFLFGIVLISLGSILPALTFRFALNDMAAGSLASLLPFGVLTGSLLFGPVVDRYGYRALLAACTLLVALGLEGLAFAESFIMVQAAIYVIGLGGGVLNGATNALVADISEGERGASLSLLGVFFGIGALGMPALLGLLAKRFSQESIIAGIGAFVLLVVLFFLVTRFPAPKQQQGFPLARGMSLLKDPTLLLFGFILFFESGMEGMVNNWTTTYLHHTIGTSDENALFALSCFVGGLALARLVLSRALKLVSPWTALFISVGCILLGVFLLLAAGTYSVALIGLVLTGIGFAAVFPVVLGAVGDAYAALSGTAFSIVLVIALVGSTILNYLVGILAHAYGITAFPLMVLASACCMCLLIVVMRKRLTTSTGH